jgi:hypothetical protein
LFIARFHYTRKGGKNAFSAKAHLKKTKNEISVEYVTEQITAIRAGASENFYDFLPTMQNFKCFSSISSSFFWVSLSFLFFFRVRLTSYAEIRFVILARKSY